MGIYISFESSGWVRFDDSEMPGPVYLRYRRGDARPSLTEFYLNASTGEIQTGALPTIDLKRFHTFAIERMSDWPEWRIASFFEESNDRPSPRSVEVRPPEPVQLPSRGLNDEFLHTVAANYRWAVAAHKRPAPTIAAQAQVQVRTVHAWIRKARERDILAPTTQGRAG